MAFTDEKTRTKAEETKRKNREARKRAEQQELTQEIAALEVRLIEYERAYEAAVEREKKLFEKLDRRNTETNRENWERAADELDRAQTRLQAARTKLNRLKNGA